MVVIPTILLGVISWIHNLDWQICPRIDLHPRCFKAGTFNNVDAVSLMIDFWALIQPPTPEPETKTTLGP